MTELDGCGLSFGIRGSVEEGWRLGAETGTSLFPPLPFPKDESISDTKAQSIRDTESERRCSGKMSCELEKANYGTLQAAVADCCPVKH